MGCSNDKSLNVEETKKENPNQNDNQKQKEENERLEREQREKEAKEREQREREQREKEERAKKEKELEEQNKNNSTNADEQSGNEVGSHNSTIPADTGRYLNIPLNTKKNNVFIPNKTDLERFQRDALKRHNYYRKYHQAGPMELTQKLNDFAQKYAETLAAKNTMQHSTHDVREKIYGDWTGENLYYFWTSASNLTINGAAAVDDWYDEIKDYDFENGCSKNGGVVGHFTQLVWKDSIQLGIGVAKSSQNSVFVVANYHPGGNFNRMELENVFPASSDPANIKPAEKKEESEKNEQENNEEKTESPKDDEQSGKEVKSHNSTIPSDAGHYLYIPLKVKKNNIFVPNKSDLERFQRDGLKRHNYYRKYHQAGPMELTQKLNDFAQQYAETLAAKDTMQHSTHDVREKIYGDWTGENLYYFWTSDRNLTISGAEAVDSWYDEIKDYDFSKGKSKNKGVVGHFTQLVWKDSTQLGIGVARSSKNSVYIVANYHPGGNFNSNELNNVFPAKV